MQSIEEALISFFNQVALKDNAILVKLKSERCFNIDDESWQFILPDLHFFLQQQDTSFSQVDYLSFRKILFGCPINQSLKLNGGEIVILKNHNNVDKSLYALVWN